MQVYLHEIPSDVTELIVKYELEGTLGVDARVRFSNILVENYMLSDTHIRCQASVRLPTSIDTPFYSSYKALLAALGAITYYLGHPLSVTTGGHEGIPRGYFGVEQSDWSSPLTGVNASLEKIYESIDIENVYQVQALLYYTKTFKFRSDVYESIMNLVRFLECVVLGIRKSKSAKTDVDVKLTVQTNQNYLKSLGLTAEEFTAIMELNALRNQLVGHGLLSPEIEEIYGLYETSKNMPKYYEVTPGPTYGLDRYVRQRMDAVKRVFQLYYGTDIVSRAEF